MSQQPTQFKPGNPGGPSRKGIQNRYTRLRNALLDAIEEVGEEIQRKIQAKTGKPIDPTRYSQTLFTQLVAKAANKEPANLLRVITSLLPKEIKAEFTDPLKVIVKYVRMNGDENPND